MSIEKEKAPDFILEGSDGKQHSLSDYAGKKVVIYFYPKDNTPGCTKEACGFRDNFQSLADKGFVVIGVSKDSITSHNKFISQHNLPFLLLSDPDAEMMKRYEAFGEKVMYGKKTVGVIRSTVLIDENGIVEKHWRKVAKAEQHPAQVIEYIDKKRG